MKIEGIALDNLKIVPEEIIAKCAADFLPNEQNRYKSSMEEALEFRKAGLSPVYLCAFQNNTYYVFVTSHEKLRKEYN